MEDPTYPRDPRSAEWPRRGTPDSKIPDEQALEKNRNDRYAVDKIRWKLTKGAKGKWAYAIRCHFCDERYVSASSAPMFERPACTVSKSSLHYWVRSYSLEDGE